MGGSGTEGEDDAGAHHIPAAALRLLPPSSSVIYDQLADEIKDLFILYALGSAAHAPGFCMQPPSRSLACKRRVAGLGVAVHAREFR
jgi:hypothetical protein